MPLAPLAARRLALLGCALAVAAALLLTGCGDGDSATADDAAATQGKTETSARMQPTAVGCPRQVNAFVTSLSTLRRQLAVGLSYEQYAARVRMLGRSYRRLPIDHLSIECVTASGTPAEVALNKYIDAANAWGKCLADASCTTATIEPVLQGKWRVASRLLGEAE